MLIRALFFGLALVPLALTGCQNDQSAQHLTTTETPLPSSEARRFAAHVKFLSDDLLQGRETGSPGYDIAARYVASQFEQLGVAPGGDDGTYFQNITFKQAFLDLKQEPTLTVHANGEDQTFAFRDDFIASESLISESESITAPLVFVGYGIESDWLNHHDYEGLDVEGKIVVVLPGKPKSFPSEEGAHFGSGRLKYKNAASRGAVGIISLQTPSEEARYPFTRRLNYLDHPRVSYLNSDGSPANAYPEIKGNASLDLEASERLFTLANQSIESVFQTLEQDEVPKGFDLGISATLTRHSRFEEIYSPNVIGVIEGSDPVLKQEYVSFAAHLDHIGISHKDDEDIIYNGALDNAAGVAAILENARLLSELPERPKRSIIFVLVTGEEKGLRGSDYYANNPTVEIDKIVANINLDMPVILFPFTNVIAFGAQHSSLKETTNRALAKLNLELIDDPIPEEAIFVRSDHYSFVKQGVVSVMLEVGFGSSDPELDGETLFFDFLKNHYHQVSDDINLPINYEAGALFSQVNFMIGLEVANTEQRPTWNEGDFFGETFGKGVSE